MEISYVFIFFKIYFVLEKIFCKKSNTNVFFCNLISMQDKKKYLFYTKYLIFYNYHFTCIINSLR